jgi:hypothetical protein
VALEDAFVEASGIACPSFQAVLANIQALEEFDILSLSARAAASVSSFFLVVAFSVIVIDLHAHTARTALDFRNV